MSLLSRPITIGADFTFFNEILSIVEHLACQVIFKLLKHSAFPFYQGMVHAAVIVKSAVESKPDRRIEGNGMEITCSLSWSFV